MKQTKEGMTRDRGYKHCKGLKKRNYTDVQRLGCELELRLELELGVKKELVSAYKCPLSFLAVFSKTVLLGVALTS